MFTLRFFCVSHLIVDFLDGWKEHCWLLHSLDCKISMDQLVARLNEIRECETSCYANEKCQQHCQRGTASRSWLTALRCFLSNDAAQGAAQMCFTSHEIYLPQIRKRSLELECRFGGLSSTRCCAASDFFQLSPRVVALLHAAGL